MRFTFHFDNDQDRPKRVLGMVLVAGIVILAELVIVTILVTAVVIALNP